MNKRMDKTDEVAYWSGFGAYRDGLSWDKNAYGPGRHPRHDSWLLGWVDARIEEARVPGVKKLRGSKTIWFGLGLVALAALGIAWGLPTVQGHPVLAMGVLGASGVVVVLLRLVSRQGIALPGFLTRK